MVPVLILVNTPVRSTVDCERNLETGRADMGGRANSKTAAPTVQTTRARAGVESVPHRNLEIERSV